MTSNWVSFHYNPFAFYLMITFVVWRSLYHHTWLRTIFRKICLLIMDGVGRIVSFLKMMKFFHGLWNSWRFWFLSGSFTNENIEYTNVILRKKKFYLKTTRVFAQFSVRFSELQISWGIDKGRSNCLFLFLISPSDIIFRTNVYRRNFRLERW